MVAKKNAAFQLSALKRTVLGRKVKQLRREGNVPGNIFGKKLKSLAVTISLPDLKKAYKTAGETQLIDLTLKSESKPRPVLITNIQADPISKHILHADFRQVDLTQKVNAMVPLEFVGKSAAEAQGAVVVTLKDEIEVLALPREIPEKLAVDLSKLTKVGNMLTVADLNIDRDKVTPTLPDSEIIVKAEEPKAEEVEAPKAEEAASTETETGATATEADSGKPATGEKTPENKPSTGSSENTPQASSKSQGK